MVDGKPYDVTVEAPEESNGGTDPVTAPAASAPIAPPPVAPAPPAPAPVAAQPVAPATPAALAAKGGPQPGDVPSPLSGRVIAVVAQVGQEVKENDHLLTLEAMKMNTFVFAPKSGKVLEIKVAVGDVVNESQMLARIG